MSFLQRSEMIIGKENIGKLKNSKVLVFGVGGVGGSLVESLTRAGIGQIDIVDRDVFDITNLNRQVMATLDSVGNSKVEETKKRLLSINSDLICNSFFKELNENTIDEFDLESYTYIADAIDSVSSKVLLAKTCEDRKIKLISSMGAGNRLDPTKFMISDISKTHSDPLAKVMRKKLKEAGVKKLKCVFSTELPTKPIYNVEKSSTPGSMSFVPPVCGMVMASQIVREIIGE
ncbi:tRNA threonylcarbamoyladenosine dehydratase [Peptoniphilus indolicus]|uniref:Probable adenylyltransferase/sulfurtransferase MoeZ n=1 Tax=Peptoniphilus indolicus TaxID=33030 RepID=A0A379DEP4_9FIRM|nr:tRNA threonylcarbamoyladenosine dehydratase [Peptoniphilus indolicus]SUB76025.1 Probable adenylyltransferase/sulfurtransferase MoeZ [Peptoniphilus indolicus]